MNKHKMLSAIAIGAGTLALLTGCVATTPPSSETPTTRTADLGGVVTKGTVTVDGKMVPCVTWVNGAGSSKVGGISCDWASATPVK